MNRLCLPFALFVGCLVGCTDTIDSVSREYRNAHNEIIDAMMMVTSEERAGEMTERVFKSSNERYSAIDKRLETVERNTATKKEFVMNVFSSNGAHLYLTELEVNAQRYSLEMVRMRHLANAYLEKKRAGGEEADESHLPMVCPKLFELIKSDSSLLGPIRKQLTAPKLVQMMSQFQTWAPEEYEKVQFPVFKAKREAFKVPEVNLVW